MAEGKWTLPECTVAQKGAAYFPKVFKIKNSCAIYKWNLKIWARSIKYGASEQKTNFNTPSASLHNFVTFLYQFSIFYHHWSTKRNYVEYINKLQNISVSFECLLNICCMIMACYMHKCSERQIAQLAQFAHKPFISKNSTIMFHNLENFWSNENLLEVIFVYYYMFVFFFTRGKSANRPS